MVAGSLLVNATLEPLQRLTRDLKAATVTLSPREVRYLVDLYYEIQENRKRANNQAKALERSEEPHEVIGWVHGTQVTLENDIRRALDAWSIDKPLGQWCRSICGIGPVITAGLMAHIDITRAPTVGHVWRYAGLDPTITWGKGQKRPWNASLKVICWKIGQSFMKVQNNEKDIYGAVYVERKAFEQARDSNGYNATVAKASLETKRYGHGTTSYVAYSQGKLPAAQIDARARRYATKLFLAHYHHVAYELEYGKAPPMPYVIAFLGHADYIGPPNWPME